MSLVSTTHKKRIVNVANQRFGRLVAIRKVGKDKYKQNLWLCRCDCGKECITNTNRLSQGKTRSCGCLKAEGNNIRHGMCYTRLNSIYRKMKARCLNPNNPRYSDYGGRNIQICSEWIGKDGFKNFAEWAYKNGYSDALTIDRIDNNKGYSPDNCRWADAKTQNRNTRRNHLLMIDGVTKTMAEWSEISGVPYTVLIQRINKLKWNPKRAITEEVKNA